LGGGKIFLLLPQPNYVGQADNIIITQHEKPLKQNSIDGKDPTPMVAVSFTQFQAILNPYF